MAHISFGIGLQAPRSKVVMSYSRKGKATIQLQCPHCRLTAPSTMGIHSHPLKLPIPILASLFHPNLLPLIHMPQILHHMQTLLIMNPCNLSLICYLLHLHLLCLDDLLASLLLMQVWQSLRRLRWWQAFQKHTYLRITRRRWRALIFGCLPWKLSGLC